MSNETQGFMASNKGTTGPIFNTAQEAANDFFTRYSTQRKCTTRHVTEVSPGMTRTTATALFEAVHWVKAKGKAVNAQN